MSASFVIGGRGDLRRLRDGAREELEDEADITDPVSDESEVTDEDESAVTSGGVGGRFSAGGGGDAEYCWTAWYTLISSALASGSSS